MTRLLILCHSYIQHSGLTVWLVSQLFEGYQQQQNLSLSQTSPADIGVNGRLNRKILST